MTRQSIAIYAIGLSQVVQLGRVKSFIPNSQYRHTVDSAYCKMIIAPLTERSSCSYDIEDLRSREEAPVPAV